MQNIFQERPSTLERRTIDFVTVTNLADLSNLLNLHGTNNYPDLFNGNNVITLTYSHTEINNCNYAFA